MFAQDFIDRARLVRESRSFLGEGELMAQFKEILGWDEAMERSALAKEREELYQPPGRPLTILDRPSREELNIRYGSYRRLPADVSPCRLASLYCMILSLSCRKSTLSVAVVTKCASQC
jgi:paired amphipathic helix protein Sin3a